MYGESAGFRNLLSAPRRLCRPLLNRHPASRFFLHSFRLLICLVSITELAFLQSYQQRCLNQFTPKRPLLNLQRVCRVLRTRQMCLSPFLLSSSTVLPPHPLPLLRKRLLHRQLAMIVLQMEGNNHKTMARPHRKTLQSKSGSISCFRPSKGCL